MSDHSGIDLDGYDGSREFARHALVTGTAVTLPLLITLMVLGFVVDFVSQQLDPVVGVFTQTTGMQPASEPLLKGAAVVALVAGVFLIGVVAEYRQGRSDVGTFFDMLVSRIPGVGSLYQSLEDMSRLLMDNDSESFRDVKLVEFPAEGSYSIAFLTADTPELVERAAGHESMVTVFLPMAPNPVMGGYVLHVAADRVHDVDLTVEEGIQSIVTSGVATGHREQAELPEDVLERLNRRLNETRLVSGLEEVEYGTLENPLSIRDAVDGRTGTDREDPEDDGRP